MKGKFEGAEYILRPGMTVLVNDRSVFGTTKNWVPATIKDMLSLQFTAVIHDSELQQYCLYQDRGSTWKPAS